MNHIPPNINRQITNRILDIRVICHKDIACPDYHKLVFNNSQLDDLDPLNLILTIVSEEIEKTTLY